MALLARYAVQTLFIGTRPAHLTPDTHLPAQPSQEHAFTNLEDEMDEMSTTNGENATEDERADIGCNGYIS